MAGSRSRSPWAVGGGFARCDSPAAPLPGAVGGDEVGEHPQSLVYQPMAGRLAPVVPGAVDTRFGRNPRVDVVLGAGRGHGALVGNEAGERLAAGALVLRINHARDGRAPTTVSAPMPWLVSGIHRPGTLFDGHTHGVVRSLYAASPSPGAAAFDPWQVLAQVQRALRFGVYLLDHRRRVDQGPRRPTGGRVRRARDSPAPGRRRTAGSRRSRR